MRTLALTSGGRRLAAAFVFAAGLALAGPAAADEVAGAAAGAADGTVVEKLLDIMLQQQSITRAQYDALLEQAREEQAAAAARMAEAAKAEETAPVAAGPPGWGIKWDNGFNVAREDGAFKLKFGGRVQLDGAVIATSNGLDDDLSSGSGTGQGNGVEFRRARLFFEGTVYERLFFRAQYDFADGEPAFKDVYMGLRGLGPVGSIQVGQFKEPFFLDEQTSSNYITFMERPLGNAFFPDRNVGAMAFNNALDKRLLWQLGVFRDTDDFGEAFSSFSSSDWDVAARLTGLPIWEDEGSHYLHVGADYVHRFVGSDSVSYSQRPESHLADRFVNTNGIRAGDTNLFDAELAYVRGPLALQSEYTHSLVNGDDGQSNVGFWGAYGQVSYFLTGEHKVYEPEYGRFGRTKPKANFNPAEGGWGAWEVAARYSYLDLDDSNVRGGRLWDVTAGVNWYLFPNARIMFNYIYADVSGRRAPATSSPFTNVGGTGNIVQSRFQIDF
jgi:phosphate-selective porin OprO/OprP